MSPLSRLAALWRNLFHRRLVERDLDDELRSTLDMIVDAKRRQGMTPEDARRAAAIELGGLSVVKQQVQDAKAGARIELLFQDLRYAARALRRSPVFALTATARGWCACSTCKYDGSSRRSI